MPNYNLTTQQIKDTYQQLVQVSGSAIVDGIGSLVNAFQYPSNSTFNTYSASVNTQIAALQAGSGSADWSLITNKPAGLVSGSSQVNLALAFGTASNATSASFATRSITASVAATADVSNQTTLIDVLSTTTNGSFPVVFVSANSFQQARVDATFNDFSYNPSTNTLSVSNLTAANTIVGNILGNLTGTSSFADTAKSASRATSAASADTATSASFATNANTLDGLDSTAFAQLASNNTFSGTQTFLNIGVNGTASFAYVQQVTGSAVVIGEEFIILNTALPAARYAGIKVYDTGSTQSTASFLFDGLYNDWFYQYSGSDGTDFGVVLFGPEYSTIGNPSYPTANQIQKGTGGHHLTGSNISDNGSQVSITGPVSASTYFGDASNLTGLPSVGLISATGSFSIQSNPSLVSPQKTLVSSSYAIGIGSVRVTGEESIAIGAIITASAANSFVLGNRINSTHPGVVIGYNLTHTNGVVNIGNTNASSGDESIVIGSNSNVTAVNTIAIGFDASATAANAIAIGNQSDATAANSIAIGNNSDVNNANQISIGDIFKYNGSTLITLNAASTDAQQFSGTSITASSGFKGNLDGTASFATSASFATFALSAGSATTATSASYALSASFSTTATTATSASTALTASSANSFLVRSELELSGSVSSEVTTLTIASSTASVDLSTSNFFEKSLTAATFIANPSNAKPGSTYTFLFNSGSLISDFGTDYRFVEGTNPTLSNGQDIVTFVSFLSGSAVKLYGTGLANFY